MSKIGKVFKKAVKATYDPGVWAEDIKRVAGKDVGTWAGATGLLGPRQGWRERDVQKPYISTGLTVAGTVVGAYFGGGVGAAAGSAIGGALGNVIQGKSDEHEQSKIEKWADKAAKLASLGVIDYSAENAKKARARILTTGGGILGQEVDSVQKAGRNLLGN